MAFNQNYAESEPTRAQVDALEGAVLIEFGAPWCGHCQAAQPSITEAVADSPELSHLKIEDGPGRRLGRTFKVKLWPTLIFMNKGRELARLVRPGDSEAIRDCLKRLADD